VTIRAVAAKAASLLLRYPDEATLAAVPALRAAVTELPDALGEPLAVVADHRAAGDPTSLAVEYVELFDLRRRCCLYLSYYTAGDTRKRGEALLEFAAVYKATGFAVKDGELPDFLPAVLDLAAYAGNPAWALLRRHRVGLDLLVRALDRDKSPYRHAVQAVRVMLPPPGPAELAAAAALARSGPPREEVGLQPFALTPGGRR
jgi:nitrate reductase delta subunit